MAQLIVRNIEDDIKDKLKELAAFNGRSMEEEIRAILRAAVLKSNPKKEDKLGSKISKRFRKCGFKEGEIEEFKGQPAKPADLES